MGHCRDRIGFFGAVRVQKELSRAFFVSSRVLMLTTCARQAQEKPAGCSLFSPEVAGGSLEASFFWMRAMSSHDYRIFQGF
jgi:hypothetical protein